MEEKYMDNKKIGLFTGSFDPLTNGHLDIIKRASCIFDTLYVGIFNNDSKNPFFTTEKRKKMIEQATDSYENVKVIVHAQALTAEIARDLEVTSLVRGIRNSIDLNYECEMAFFNHRLTGVETIFLPVRADLQYISSSRIKEIFKLGGDVKPYLPDNILKEMENTND
ncbi:pantetheine-phosphate adenylyltransferase [Streptococcaceae bacterium ESL0687]|nr:pantetheine-phosphate adenylyltransferase [Streptococcaceae bacterium ESL0687]